MKKLKDKAAILIHKKVYIAILFCFMVSASIIRCLYLECSLCGNFWKWELYLKNWLCVKENFNSSWNALVALWVGTLSVFTFVIAKTTEIYYGIHLGNILLWKFGLSAVGSAIVIYFFLLPAAVYCYMNQWKIAFVYIVIWNYAYLIGMLSFVCYNIRKTSLRKAIMRQAKRNLDEIFDSSVENKTEKVNLLAVMNVVRNIDYGNSDETRNLLKMLLQIIECIQKEHADEYYGVLSPLVTAIIETSGMEKSYEVNRTIEFLIQLWEQSLKMLNLHKKSNYTCNFEEGKALLAFSILAPMIENVSAYPKGKDFASFLVHLEYAIRDRVLLLCLLYIEYLYVCDNSTRQSIKVLKRVLNDNLLAEFGRRDYSMWLRKNWYSWNIADAQNLAGRSVLEQFIMDLRQWNDKEYIGRSYILMIIKRG